MSYCLVRTLMVSHVHNGQLMCAKVKVKLGGPDSREIYNFMQRIVYDTVGRIILEKESDRDVLPTLAYRNRAEVLSGEGGVLKRIEQAAKSNGFTCRVVDAFKDAAQTTAHVFYLNQPHVVSQVLETDKEELAGKTILIGADKDVDYAGANVVPMYLDANSDLDDKELGDNLYSLYDDQTKMMVMVGK